MTPNTLCFKTLILCARLCKTTQVLEVSQVLFRLSRWENLGYLKDANNATASAKSFSLNHCIMAREMRSVTVTGMP